MNGVKPVTVQIFARAPVLGKVKTRLGPALSDEAILTLHKKLVRHCVRQVSNAGVGPMQLWVDQLPAHPFLKKLTSEYRGLTIHVQQGLDLGQRMATAIASVDSLPVILIGSDCPSIDADYLNLATAALEKSDVVLGPAADGGYVLIGSRSDTPPVFDDIEWGSAQVLRQTQAALDQAGWSLSTLPQRSDIDRPEDLAEARRFGLLDNG
ncbi:MAG: TIGR04282 family arsenosugar biosynthesis glycosyltransferase [Pseudomonadota bacterium]